MATSIEKTIEQKPAEMPASNATVTIASKLPMPLVLRLFNKGKQYINNLDGTTREVEMYVVNNAAPQITINGNSYHQDQGPGTKQIVGGYALTHNVPKQFWEQWLSQNANADYVVNNLVFAHHEYSSVTSQATDQKQISGIDRLDPNNLPKNVAPTLTTENAI